MIDSQERFLLTAALLRGQERTILSSNIANAQTPHYHAHHLDFAGALADSLQAVEAQAQAATTDPRHFYISMPAIQLSQHITANTETNPSAHQNTVNMNEERAAFVKSMVHENLMLTLLKDHYHRLEMAITGQV